MKRYFNQFFPLLFNLAVCLNKRPLYLLIARCAFQVLLEIHMHLLAAQVGELPPVVAIEDTNVVTGEAF